MGAWSMSKPKDPSNQPVRSESDFDQASRLAAAALEHAQRHKGPPQPRAFEIWYTYAAGDDDALRARVDSELIKADEVDLDTIEQIYEDHFLQKRLSRGINRIGDELDSGLQDTIGMIREGLGSSRAYLASLKQAQKKITGVSRNHDAKRVVMDLLEISRDHAEQTEAVGSELVRAREQVVNLQLELHKLRDRAYLDHLTQIANRRHMDEMLEREIRLARGSSEPLSFALGDLDHFKLLNDNNGHTVGDAVLKHFAALMRSNIKGQDTPARLGGEEFAIIFPKTSIFGARAVTENIRKLFDGTDFILSRDSSSIGRVSVSFGVTQLLSGDSMADLINRADRLLYRAKKLGRNRVETDM
jgi:diguanylate cyclase